MADQKRNVPVSDLDLQMQMIEPAYGKSGISKELMDKLKQYTIGLDAEGNERYDESSMWGILGYYTRDIRLGNLDKFAGEYNYVKYYLDLAGDLLQANMIKSFLIALSRAATVIEISQSKGGFLRRRVGTITSENHYQGLDPSKKSIMTGNKNNKG
jgi:hypothetical protein